MLKDSLPSVVLSAAAERTKLALPSEPISLELSMFPEEKSDELMSEPETV